MNQQHYGSSNRGANLSLKKIPRSLFSSRILILREYHTRPFARKIHHSRILKAYLDARVSKLIGEDEKLRSALDLVILLAPEEVEQQMDDLICTQEQTAIIDKIQLAINHREFLHRHRIHEVGKLLFVGPPGTGKTSLALAMSRTMHMPVLEVRLSMITSQYLGETSKEY